MICFFCDDIEQLREYYRKQCRIPGRDLDIRFKVAPVVEVNDVHGRNYKGVPNNVSKLYSQELKVRKLKFCPCCGKRLGNLEIYTRLKPK